MIFPDWGTSPAPHTGEALPLYTEWAVDWDKGCFALRNGQPYTVTGNEALKIWVLCALHPESVRFLCSAHSADYGNTLANLMGQNMEESILDNCLRREIRESLLVSPYIQSVDNFLFSRQGECITVSFTVHTVYEDFEQEVRV